jgi:hypothetical protein
MKPDTRRYTSRSAIRTGSSIADAVAINAGKKMPFASV